MSSQRAIYWFTNDLRLNDNPLLDQVIKRSASIAFLYLFDPFWFTPRNYQQRFLGSHYLSFIIDSLLNLERQLSGYGHRLYITKGNTQEVLKCLLKNNAIDVLASNKQIGSYEQSNWQRIENDIPESIFLNRWNNTLFEQDELFPIGQENLPLQHKQNTLKSFTKFRHSIEEQHLTPRPFGTEPHSLPDPIYLKGQFISVSELKTKLSNELIHSQPSSKESVFVAGESSAKLHVKQYFASSAPSSYKQTRNALDGWNTSTKFSPYLAHGNISPRRLWAEVEDYENDHIKNEDTYWIKFELLWREYFHWLAERQGDQLFRFSGISGHKPLTSYFPERFMKWCKGNTPFPIVNACMRQLNATGFLSNRGRQLAASCLVNELAIDWRYGAAYFQEKLIDHDLASNWGNWQYIAGVGTDPRGSRHFNLDKQTELYDPKQHFIKKWQGHQSSAVLDSVDAADWPVTPLGREH